MNNALQNTKTAFAKKSFYVFSGKVLPLLVLFIITILYSRGLSYDDYGRFQSVWMYTNIINVIISFGFISILLSTNLAFLFSFIRKYKIKIIFYYSLLTIIVFVLFFYYSKNFSTPTLYILILFIITRNIATVAEVFLIKINKEGTVLIINFVYSVFFLAWHVYVLYQNYDLNRLILGTIVITVIKFIITLFFSHSTSSVPKEEEEEEEEKDKVFARHWIYLGLNDITATTSKWLDKLFLLYLLTAKDFAIYFNGSFEIPLFGLLITVSGSLLLIDISAEKISTEKVIKSFNSYYRMLTPIVFPLFIFLLFYRNELFAIGFDHKYDESIPIFLINIMGLPIRVNNYSALLQCYSKGNIIIRGSVIDISSATILMIVLYPIMGTKGVALAFVIPMYIHLYYYLYQSAKVMKVKISDIFPIRYFLTNLIILAALFAGLSYAMNKESDWIKLTAGAVLSCICISGGLYYFYRRKITI